MSWTCLGYRERQRPALAYLLPSSFLSSALNRQGKDPAILLDPE